eukprot:scaffold36481_cov69-Phaeocystis_antarctica.AAC.3
MDQLHPKARRPRRALHLRCEVCALRPRRMPWPPRMPCAQEPPGAPESRAAAATLLTSLTARAGWVAPVTGMGQWGSGLRPGPKPRPRPRLGRQVAVRAPGGAPGPGPRRRAQGARGAGGRPVSPELVSVQCIPSRERVAGAQGRISRRADCAYRLPYIAKPGTPHTPFRLRARLLFRLQRAVSGRLCGNAASRVVGLRLITSYRSTTP